MKKDLISILSFFAIILLASCSQGQTTSVDQDTDNLINDYKILALGDSYTKGESVCNACGFPKQLVDSLEKRTSKKIGLLTIAQTGWTTTHLFNEAARVNLDADYDFVTLLIGVNNQYQGKPFSLYETEFPALLDIAIASAGGNTEKIIVLSIPDWAFTPFGQSRPNPERISEEIDRYNDFAKITSEAKGVRYQNITDITRMGIEQPELVANDGLHPSTLAYTKFVERIVDGVFNQLD